MAKNRDNPQKIANRTIKGAGGKRVNEKGSKWDMTKAVKNEGKDKGKGKK